MTSGANGERPSPRVLPVELAAPRISVRQRVAEIDTAEGLRRLVITDEDDNPTPRPTTPVLPETCLKEKDADSTSQPATPVLPEKFSCEDSLTSQPATPELPETYLKENISTLHSATPVFPEASPNDDIPSIHVTPPSVRKATKQRPRQLSTDIPATEKPKLKKRPFTAPPGTLYLTKPQPPRRAISARSPLASSGHENYNDTMVESAQESRRGETPESSPKISRRLQKQSPRMKKTPTGKLFGLKQSFSEKNRVKEMLKSKKVEKLMTDLKDFTMKGSPKTADSIVDTPQEMYGSGTTSSHGSGSGRRVLPPVTSTGAEFFSLSLTPDMQQGETLERSISPTRTGSIEHRNTYVAGPIRVERRLGVGVREGSIATMEPFDSGRESRGKRFSDTVAVDGVVMFFEQLGVLEEASEACLDQYWLDDRGQQDLASGSRKAARRWATPVSPALLSSPWPSERAPLRSPGTPTRQRDKLRRLLTKM